MDGWSALQNKTVQEAEPEVLRRQLEELFCIFIDLSCVPNLYYAFKNICFTPRLRQIFQYLKQTQVW